LDFVILAKERSEGKETKSKDKTNRNVGKLKRGYGLG
jgi:hypothetical protein